MKKTNPIKSLAGQTLVYGMGTIVPRILNYFLVPFYTRIFDQALYGQITELYAYLAFLLVLLTYGMETAFFRYAQKHDTQKVFNNIFSSILFTSGIFFVAAVILFPVLADMIHYSGNPEYILFIAGIVVLDALTAIPFALLRKQNKAGRFAMIKIVNVVVNVGLNLLFLIVIPDWSLQTAQLFFGASASLVIWVFISNLLASLLSLIMLFPSISTYKWDLSFAFLKPVFQYALPVLVVGLAGMVNEMIDKILLKYLVNGTDNPLAQLGIYSANYKLGVLMTLFIQMFRYAAEPFFFAEAEKKDSKQLFAVVMNYFVIAGLLIFLGVSLLIDLFQYFIGPDFREGLFIVPIILLANLFYGIYYNLAIWYKLTDRTGDGAKIAVGGAVITIVLNIVMVPVFGYAGAAWAHFVCYFIMMTISFIWGQKVYPIPYQLKNLAKYLALALAIYYLATHIPISNHFWRLSANFGWIALFALLALSTEYKNSRHLIKGTDTS
ncbi:MAG: oligosaccharide flippase family protein [Bacteroidales bacterium]|nr:oligosaccharide flippase family protein [Bacteroidales bacterium]